MAYVYIIRGGDVENLGRKACAPTRIRIFCRQSLQD